MDEHRTWDMQLTLEKTLRWFVVCGIFTIPFIALLTVPSMYQPFEAAKGFAFRIIVEIITGLWLTLALVSNQYRPPRTWVLSSFAIFTLIMAVANLQGVNQYASFWSNYTRMDGWISVLHVFMYIVVASSILSSKKMWQALFHVSLAVSVIVGIYGLLQLAGIEVFIAGQSGWGARIGSTMGNPSYLAVYMLFHIFIAALLWVQACKEFPKNKLLLPSFVYTGVIILDTAVLFLTGTRGAILGLFCGGILTLVVFAFLQRSQKIRWIASVVILIVATSSVSLWIAKDTTLVRNVGFLKRLTSISLRDSSIQSRLIINSVSLQGVMERPILGWGQENYIVVYEKYFDPRITFQRDWADRAHNILFEVLISGGFLGLVAYLLVFLATIWSIWQGSRFSRAEQSILTGLLAGYFLQNLVFFDIVESYILFGTVLAYITWQEGTELKSEPIHAKHHLFSQNSLPYFTVLAIILSCTVAWRINADAISANLMLMRALTKQEAGLSRNLEYFKKAISYNSFGTEEARRELARITSLISIDQSVSDDVKREFFDYTKQQLQLQVKSSPLNAPNWLFLGQIYTNYGDFMNGKEALQSALRLSPNNQGILYQLAVNAAMQNDHTSTLQYLKAAFDLNRENLYVRIGYAAEAILTRDDSLANELLDPLIASGSADDLNIINAYFSVGRPDKVIIVLLSHLRSDPYNTGVYVSLAKAYLSTGDASNTIQTLQSLGKVSPSMKPGADVIIRLIQNNAVSRANVITQIEQLAQ